MELRTLYNNTPQEVVDRVGRDRINAKFINQKLLTVGTLRSGLQLDFKVHSNNMYLSRIWVHPFDAHNEQLTYASFLNKDAKVYCNCEMFKYFLVYALRQRKAILASKEFGLALHVSAVEKNPTNLPYLCKHLVACLYRIQKELG